MCWVGLSFPYHTSSYLQYRFFNYAYYVFTLVTLIDKLSAGVLEHRSFVTSVATTVHSPLMLSVSDANQQPKARGVYIYIGIIPVNLARGDLIY
jgi:hypothetical protein